MINTNDFVVPPGYRLVKIRTVAEADRPVLQALESMWEPIRANDSRVPPVTFDLQPGHSSSCGTVSWDTAPVIVLDLKDDSGGNLPARDVLFLLLHLASHAASSGAVSSEGRYHSAAFAEAAGKLGLEVSERIPGIGYRPEALARGTLTRYKDAMRRLDKALETWTPEVIRKRDRSAILLTCSCNPPRKIRMSPGVASIGPVVCSVCGQEFSTSTA